MTICFCCKYDYVMPTFSFYCLACYNNLLRAYRIDISDYITYFQMSYRKLVHPDDCNFDT